MQALQEATEAAIVMEFESKDMILSICNNANLIYSDKPYGTTCQTHHYLDQRYGNGQTDETASAKLFLCRKPVQQKLGKSGIKAQRSS